jgi:LacI family transcriptional regulator
MAPGRRVTIRDIAARAGVSHSTVSLVLHGAGRISSATRARVEQAMRELGYRYNRSAANLRRNVAQAIGLVVNDIANPFFAELTAAVQAAAASAGHMVFLVDSQEDPARQDTLLDSLVEHAIAGILLSPATGTATRALDRIAAWNVPCVLTVRRLLDGRFDFVGPDDVSAARLATQHLLELGHRRIAFLGARAANPARRDRLAGYQAALAEAALAVDPALLAESTPDPGASHGELDRLLALQPRPGAILCHNDFMALTAMRGLRAHGLEPGRDIAFVSIDDTPQAALFHPPLTSVSLYPREIGHSAAAALLQRIAEPERPVAETLIAPRLTVRESCGAGATG